MNTMNKDLDPLALFPDPRLSGIDGLVGFHIRLASAAVYQHFTETFSDLGLTQKQVAVLWLIQDQPAIAQADIGRRLKMDRASVMAIPNRATRGDRIPSPQPVKCRSPSSPTP